MKRCFNTKIVQSDAFLDMPLSTQCLYFHLNFSADDDGFVNNPRKIMKMLGASDDDYKLLIAKAFVLRFESGVIVIKHYRMHNVLQNDRYKPTVYEEEFKQLKIKDNKSYTFKGVEEMPLIEANNDVVEMETKWKQNGTQMETQHNTTQHNITKHNITLVAAMWTEAGYPKSMIKKITNQISLLNIKDEYLKDAFKTAVEIEENKKIIHKEEYLYTKAKAKSWIKER